MHSPALTTLLVVVASHLSACNKPESGGSPEDLKNASTESEPGNQQTIPEDAPLCSRWIAGKEARRIVAEGGVLLDVRTRNEYEEGHIEAAKNIPVDELSTRMSEIPEDRHVVVYCRSGKRAHRAATLLKGQGHQVSEIGHMGQYEPDAPPGCPE